MFRSIQWLRRCEERIGLRLVALRDLAQGEEWTRSYIDHSVRSEAERAAMLRALGLGVCDCPRCCFERHPGPYVQSLLLDGDGKEGDTLSFLASHHLSTMALLVTATTTVLLLLLLLLLLLFHCCCCHDHRVQVRGRS